MNLKERLISLFTTKPKQQAPPSDISYKTPGNFYEIPKGLPLDITVTLKPAAQEPILANIETNLKGNTMNILTLIPTIINAIKTVEAAATAPNADGTPQEPSTGQQRFDAMIAIVESIYGSTVTLLPVIQMLATTLVEAYRAKGLFAKKGA